MSESLLSVILKKHQNSFAAVVPFDAAKDRILQLDFTAANKELTQEMISDTHAFIQYINDKLLHAGARYGIGGYGEHRTLYSMSNVFDGTNANEEPRRLHLGTDIWGKPYTPVIAPLDGIVHSFAFNNRHGDYGATIILTHFLEGKTFYTLYGHLSLNSIKNCNAGDRVMKGDYFAELGIPMENGGWPPHLHFQLIENIGDHSGDYPGVCKYSEREKWLMNSPDPELILGFDRFMGRE